MYYQPVILMWTYSVMLSSLFTDTNTHTNKIYIAPGILKRIRAQTHGVLQFFSHVSSNGHEPLTAGVVLLPFSPEE